MIQGKNHEAANWKHPEIAVAGFRFFRNSSLFWKFRWSGSAAHHSR
jgi:hypothetical protein